MWVILVQTLGHRTTTTRHTCMSHEPTYFEGNRGLQFFENVWRPDGVCNAVLVIVHGFTEHSGRYAHVANKLNSNAMAVYAMDLRGHGRSEGDRIWVDSFDEYLDDVAFYIERVRRREPGKPIVLLGHSLGGTMAVLLVAQRQLDADGLVLSAPALSIGEAVFPILRRLAALVARVMPRLRLVRLGAGRLSRDADNVTRFRADPLVCHGRIPIRTAAEILRAVQRAAAAAAAVRMPLLVMQGGADAVVAPSASRDFCFQAATKDRTLQWYDGLYHDLFGEPEREQVLADLVAWLNEHRG